MRSRRTAAAARAAMGAFALVFAMTDLPHASLPQLLAAAGFAVIFATGVVQLISPRTDWLKIEESLAPVSAVLIVGLGPERVTTLAVLWLGAVASGVLARGGRQYWAGRALLLMSLALPVARAGVVNLSYACLVVTTIALLLTCGRVTRELRDMLDRARYDADHDELTGALSRSAFRAKLDEVAAAAMDAGDPAAQAGLAGHAAARTTALLLSDVDNFRAVNKSHGHAAGDAVLRRIVEQMRAAVGQDGVIGRLGGDEFAAIVTSSEPQAVAQGLLADFAVGPSGSALIRTSLGMALIPRDGDDAESLLRAGDVALRVAKRSGKHQLSVYAGESISNRGPGGALEALERLIGGDGLTMAVQPIVAVPECIPHAFEALARFQTGASSNPLHWFALADEFGVRDRLEFACLRTALVLLGSRPPGTSLSVNLSGPLLLDPRTDELLAQTAGLDGLILELTENSLLDDTPGLHAQISRLLALGIRFAVDDMGAGYSGLRQIATVRPSYLKLDRSLISGIDTDPDRGALVSAMLGYARQTGGHLVAEGVETREELETLLDLGVELIQGYYLGRPGVPWPKVTRPAAPLAQRPSAAGMPGVGRVSMPRAHGQALPLAGR